MNAASLSATARFDPMPFEVDFTGFLSNTVAPRWMETLRVSLMRQHFSSVQMDSPANLSVIATTEISYLAPVRFGDVVEGRVWVEKVTTSRWHVAFEFFNSTLGRASIAAQQTGAFLDPDSFRPVRIPLSVIQAATQPEGTSA